MACFRLLRLSILALIFRVAGAFLAPSTVSRSSSWSLEEGTVRRREESSVQLHLPAFSAPEPQLVTDLLLAGTLGFATDPFVEMFLNSTHRRGRATDPASAFDFKATFLYGAADSISVAARVFGVAIVTELFMDALALESPFAVSLRNVAPELGFTMWAALTLCAVKRSIFRQAVSGEQLGRVMIYDRLIDFVVAIITLTQILDVLSIDIGMGLQSIISAGGVGALIFSLASKDLAQQIVGGFTVSVWDAFVVGEDVRLGDGTEGTIVRIGLVETEICGFDNVAIRIPNSQLVNQRVSNISRTKRSQVKQVLRFHYSDSKNIPKVLSDIKEEIRSSCPKLITDGSKPFHALLSSYQPDHVQAELNCHFNIQPGSREFATNREQVLLAIARGVEKSYGVEFAIPSINYQTSGTSALDSLD